MFEANFHATYTHLGQVDDLFACVQKPDESLRDFIQYIRNMIPDMIEDLVIVAFQQGCKDEKTTEKLATKYPKTVAKLCKIIKATTKVADAQARVHGHLDSSQAADDKKTKNKKRKKGDTNVLAAEKGKPPPQCQGKPDDLPVYCPIHRSTKLKGPNG